MKLTEWFASHRLAIVASIASASAAAVLSGVGITLASTQPVDASVTETSSSSTPAAEPTATDEPLSGDGPSTGGSSRPARPVGLSWGWSGGTFIAVWNGDCSAPVTVSIFPENMGRFAEPTDGMSAIGGGAESTLCTPGHKGESGLSVSVRYWLCYHFDAIWVDVSGPTPSAGRNIIPVPGSVTPDCSMSSGHTTDPNAGDTETTTPDPAPTESAPEPTPTVEPSATP